MTTEPMSLRSRLYADADQPADELAPARIGQPRTPVPAPGTDRAEPEFEAEAASDPLEFPPEDVVLPAELPPGAALLRVENITHEGRPSIGLHFHHRGRVSSPNRPHHLASRRPPGLGIPQLVARATSEGGTWSDTYLHLKGWWQTQPVLAAWVDRLRQGDDPALIVWDQTAHEIPWELLHREPVGIPAPDDPAGDTGGWLGAVLPVIRWTTVWDGDRAWRYDARPRHCKGGVMVYEDPDFAVDQDGVAQHEIGTRSTTMADLRTRLKDTRTGFGLLLMRCHGGYSEDIRQFTLGGVPYPQLSLNWKMYALHASGAAVLINSCVSARPVVDDRYKAAVPRNFAEVFLKWGAGAVIATVAEVSKVHAHDFAARLVRKAARNGPVNLAEELTRHRAYYAREAERALEDADEPRVEQALEAFFSGFMYVYFGHPGTTLTLEKPGREGREGGDGT
ncbi:hypothetical protein [Streptomyces sp. NPDC002671]